MKWVSSQRGLSCTPLCATLHHSAPLACYTQMSNSSWGKCALAGGSGYGRVLTLMHDPHCATWGICSPVEPSAKHTWTPPAADLHLYLHTAGKPHSSATWAAWCSSLRDSPRPVSDDIRCKSSILQACGKRLVEAKTGLHSTMERLDGNSCWNSLSKREHQPIPQICNGWTGEEWRREKNTVWSLAKAAVVMWFDCPGALSNALTWLKIMSGPMQNLIWGPTSSWAHPSPGTNTRKSAIKLTMFQSLSWLQDKQYYVLHEINSHK